jgi:hypothetical protein
MPTAPATAIPATDDGRGPHPRRAAILRHRGPYLAETVTLDERDADGWQRVTRERDGALIARLSGPRDTREGFILERTLEGQRSSLHPNFRAAMNAIGTMLDRAEGSE